MTAVNYDFHRKMILYDQRKVFSMCMEWVFCGEKLSCEQVIDEVGAK